MKIFICLLFASLTDLKTSGQISQLEYIINTEYILNHKIKSVKIVGDSSLIIQDYDKKGQLISEKDENVKRGLHNQHIANYTYDNYGVVLENHSDISQEWNVINDNEKFERKNTYKYLRDEFRNLIFKISILENNVADTIMTYINNEDGKVVKSILNDDLYYLFFYADNKLIQRSYLSTDKITRNNTYVYRKNKLIIKRDFSYLSSDFGDTDYTQFKYYYGNNDQIIKITTSTHKIKEKTSFDNGLIKSSKNISQLDSSTTHINYYLPYLADNNIEKSSAKNISITKKPNLLEQKSLNKKDLYSLKIDLIDEIKDSKSIYNLSYQFYK